MDNILLILTTALQFSCTNSHFTCEKSEETKDDSLIIMWKLRQESVTAQQIKLGKKYNASVQNLKKKKGKFKYLSILGFIEMKLAASCF